MSTLLNYVRELVALTGPSGHEEDVVRYMVKALEGIADEVTVDPLGNVIAKKKGGDLEGGYKLLKEAVLGIQEVSLSFI